MVGKDNINLLSPEHLVKGLRIYLFPELYIIGIISLFFFNFHSTRLDFISKGTIYMQSHVDDLVH